MSSAHTGKGKIDVLCEYCSNFQSTNMYYLWLLLCWPKFPPGGMVWPFPGTRNLDKSGFLRAWSELKSSRSFLLILTGLLVMSLWWWAVSLLERKAIPSRFFFRDYHKGEVQKAFLHFTFLKTIFRWSSYYIELRYVYLQAQGVRVKIMKIIRAMCRSKSK